VTFGAARVLAWAVLLVGGGAYLAWSVTRDPLVPGGLEKRVEETRPKGHEAPSPPAAEATATVLRVVLHGGEGLPTEIRVGDKAFVFLPPPEDATDEASKTLVASREKAYAEVRARIAAALAADPTLRGEVVAEPGVPHAEAVRALNAFVEAGVRDVNIVAMPAPAKPR
jgi:hypothetical protein